MSFCIVEFHGIRREIAVVHSTWISGEKCYWPHFWHSSTQLTNAIRKGMKPDTKLWSSFEAHVVGNRYYASYDEARNNLNRAEDGSEFSDGNGPRKGKACLTLVKDSDSDDSVEEKSVFVTPPTKKKKSMAQVQLTPPPAPPTIIPKKEINATSESTTSFSQLKNDADHAPTCLRQDSPIQYNPVNTGYGAQQIYIPSRQSFVPYGIMQRGVQNQCFNSYVGSGNQDAFMYSENHDPMFQQHTGGYHPQPSLDQSQRAVGQLPVDGNLPRADISHDEVVAAVRSLQHGQDLLIAKLDSVLEILRTSSHSADHTATSTTLRWTLPLTSLEKFYALENLVSDDVASKDTLITILSYKGGNNGNQITHRVMAGLMTDNLMALFTFAGQSGKHSFAKTKLMSCVCAAVRKNPKGSLSSDKEIEKAVEYWLKKTGTRMNKGFKNTNKPALTNDVQNSGSNEDYASSFRENPDDV